MPAVRQYPSATARSPPTRTAREQRGNQPPASTRGHHRGSSLPRLSPRVALAIVSRARRVRSRRMHGWRALALGRTHRRAVVLGNFTTPTRVTERCPVRAHHASFIARCGSPAPLCGSPARPPRVPGSGTSFPRSDGTGPTWNNRWWSEGTRSGSEGTVRSWPGPPPKKRRIRLQERGNRGGRGRDPWWSRLEPLVSDTGTRAARANFPGLRAPREGPGAPHEGPGAPCESLRYPEPANSEPLL